MAYSLKQHLSMIENIQGRLDVISTVLQAVLNSNSDYRALARANSDNLVAASLTWDVSDEYIEGVERAIRQIFGEPPARQSAPAKRKAGR